MKLAAKLILLFLCGVVAMVALFAWQTIRRQQVWEQERRVAHAQDLVGAVAPAIRQAWESGGRVTIEQAIEVTSRSVPSRQMRWVGDEETPPVTETKTRKVSSISVTDANGKRTAYSYVPFEIEGEKVGTIEVAESTGEHDAYVEGSLWASLASLIGVAVLSAIVIYFGGVRLIGQPLSKLITQVGQIGEGQLDQKPALTSQDELGKLATAISNMSHRLSEQRDTIRHTDRLGTIGTLAAGVAHELGTPLNVVSGRAGLIASGKFTTEEITASAETIRREAERMTGTIRQLLDFARQSPSPKEAIDLRAMAMRTCELMASLARQSQADVVTDFPEVHTLVNGDAAQLQQVLTNLISNSIAAMPDGGTINVSIASAPGQVSLCVRDTGIGIKQDDIQRIFEPFVTTKDVGDGTGLGLSIAYGIVKEHGGEIQVESRVGEGTAFRVNLPIPKADERDKS